MAGADPFHDWQVDALLQAAARRSAREAAWITLLIQTGFRPREILGCRVADVVHGATVRQILNLRRNRLKGGHGMRRRSVKGRSVPLGAQAIGALSAYLRDRAAAGPLLPDSPLFLSRNHRSLSIWQANDILKDLIREAGFEGMGRFSLHSGRKTYAMRLYRISGCVLTTRDGLGHAHCSTTEAYLGSRQREAMELTLRIWNDQTTEKAARPALRTWTDGARLVSAVEQQSTVPASTDFTHPHVQELSS